MTCCSFISRISRNSDSNICNEFICVTTEYIMILNIIRFSSACVMHPSLAIINECIKINSLEFIWIYWKSTWQQKLINLLKSECSFEFDRNSNRTNARIRIWHKFQNFWQNEPFTICVHLIAGFHRFHQHQIKFYLKRVESICILYSCCVQCNFALFPFAIHRSCVGLLSHWTTVDGWWDDNNNYIVEFNLWVNVFNVCSNYIIAVLRKLITLLCASIIIIISSTRERTLSKLKSSQFL